MKASSTVLSYATIVCALLAGCSSSPTPAEGQAVLEKTIEKQSNGIIKLVKFEKTNGQEGDVMGVKFYVMDYQAEIEFVSDCYWGGSFGGFETETGKPGPFNAYLFMGKRQARAGEHTSISGKIEFQKKEKGWQGQVRS